MSHSSRETRENNEDERPLDYRFTDYVARGMAAEAIQACRSHENYDMLRFQNMENQHKEIKGLIAEMSKEMRAGFRSYDAKFWSLAIAIISLLLVVSGFLIIKALFH